MACLGLVWLELARLAPLGSVGFARLGSFKLGLLWSRFGCLRWDWFGLAGLGWVGTRCAGSSWNWLVSVEMGWALLVWTGLGSIGLGSLGFGWTRLRLGLGLAWLEVGGLDWASMGVAIGSGLLIWATTKRKELSWDRISLLGPSWTWL